MATVISDRVYTPDDLLRMPGGERFELVNGQLVEQDMGAFASWIVLTIGSEVSAFVRKHQLGMAMSSETQYQCFPDDSRRIRKPDVSFIHRSRLAPDMLQGLVRIAPDLAIEVVSENDLYYDVELKVREYLDAGVKLVWVLLPPVSLIRVYRADGSQQTFQAADEITGEDVLPGWRLSVATLFEPPPSDKPLQ